MFVRLLERYFMYMYHHFALPFKKRKLFSYLQHFVQAVARSIQLNEGSKGMSRIEISKLRKWMLMLILCIALYLSTISISHNLWRHRHKKLLNKETSADFYLKVVQSQINDEKDAKGIYT